MRTIADTWAVVPVKEPVLAKTRLAPALSAYDREQLAFAMSCDVIDRLCGCRDIHFVCVLTRAPDVVRYASSRSCYVVQEDPLLGLQRVLDDAALQLQAKGAARLLVVPADLPAMRRIDLINLLRAHEGGVTLCPAEMDAGTNAIVCSPPTVIPFQFGDNSSAKHVLAARARGVTVRALSIPTLRDIDRPDDLCWLMDQRVGPHTRRVRDRIEAQWAQRGERVT